VQHHAGRCRALLLAALGQIDERARLWTRTGPGKRTAGADIAYLGALLMPEEETVFCLFDGGEDDVRAISLHAQLPYERVLAVRWLETTRSTTPTSSRGCLDA
jgi:hypothetical protein